MCKICPCVRCDSSCDARDRALYESSKDAVVQQLGEAVIEFKASDPSELDYDNYMHTIFQVK